MQLLIHPDKSNKTTAPFIQSKNIILIILPLLCIQADIITAERICHQCDGINCLRTSYVTTQKCFNDFDICVTVFDGQTVRAQGCLEQISKELRHKCDNEEKLPHEEFGELKECYTCNTNLCNNLASTSFECLQCDSDIDENCRNNTHNLVATRCSISRTPNEYCFVKVEGKRVIRGCSNTLEEQKSCLSNANCMICQPSELKDCNDNKVTIDDSGSDGGDNSGNNGDDNGSGGGNTEDGETGVTSSRVCHQCRGINCLRTSYKATQKCHNDLDICVTVYDGQTILAQGCFEQLSEELRNKCVDDDNRSLENSEELSECVKCNENLCNNLGSNSFKCVQCDSDIDKNCSSNPFSLMLSICGISRTPNEYCFIRREGNRVIRGCSNSLEDQKSCLSSVNCTICQPSKLTGCNQFEVKDGSDSGKDGNCSDGGNNGGSDSGSGGDSNGSDSGNNGTDSGNNGSNSGNNGSDNGNNGSDGLNNGSDSGNNELDGGNNNSGGENNGDGGTETGGGNNSDNGSDNGGSNNGSENGDNVSSSSGTSNINIHILIFIVNVFFVTIVNK
ncbi:uncharacterized protein ACRADG_011240 [Cochliomyia hominivorax]